MVAEGRARSLPSAIRRRPASSRRWIRPRKACILVIVVAMLMSACGRRGSFENLMDIGVCDPGTGTFTTEIDNPFFPLPVGHQIVLQGKEFGRDLLVRITVLDEVETVVSGFAITPFVGRIPRPVGLRPNPNEIDEIVTVPLATFLDPANLRTERVVRDGWSGELLFYDCGPHVVWGATARIIHSMMELLAGESSGNPFQRGAQGGAAR